MKGDFHIHTYYSDGVFSPEKIVDLAMEAGLEVISLTDHDNVLSYGVAKEYLKNKNTDGLDRGSVLWSVFCCKFRAIL